MSKEAVVAARHHHLPWRLILATFLPLLLWAVLLCCSSEPFDATDEGTMAVRLLLRLWRGTPAHFRAHREKMARRLSVMMDSGVYLIEGESAGCPVRYRRRSVDEVAALTRRPFFLNEEKRCTGLFCPKQSKEEEGFEAYCSGQGSGLACADRGDSLLRLLLRKGQHEALVATPCDVWPYIRRRTVWLFGDSQTLDLYKALLCALRDFRDPLGGQDRKPPPDLNLAPFGIGRMVTANVTQARYFTDNKVTTVEPSCVHMVEGTRVCYIRYDSMHEMDEQLHELSTLVVEQDVSVVNFGLHHSAPQLILGLEPLLRKLQTTPIGINLYYKDVVPQHFDTATGGYPQGQKPPFVCKPLYGLKLKSDGTLRLKAGHGPKSATSLFLKGNQRNLVTLPVAEKLKIPIIHTYNMTAILHDFHRDNGAGHECSHYCWPVPGLWVHALQKTLQASPPSALPAASTVS